jgi:hypothetical protein
MSLDNNFFQELKEDIRRNNLLILLRKYKNYLLGFVLLMIIIAISIIVINSNKTENIRMFSEKFYNGVKYLEDNKSEEAIVVFNDIYTNSKAPKYIRGFSIMELAKLKLAQGKKKEAVDLYLNSYNSNEDIFIKNLSGLLAVNIMINADEDVASDKIEQLFKQLLTDDGDVLKNMILEQKGLYYISSGNLKEGVKILEDLLSEDIEQSMKKRINGIINLYI